MFSWLKKIFSDTNEQVTSQDVKCVYDAKYLEEHTITLIDNVETKANLVLKMYSDDTTHSSYTFAQEMLVTTIPVLVKSYEQTCIIGEHDTICERLGRFPVSILNDTLRALLDCTEDMLQGDTVVFQKPALTYSIQNIIQVEDILQKRRYE